MHALDIAIAACVEEPPRATPPAVPTVGSCYIVAASPTGAWTGRVGAVACYTVGGWRFLAAVEGLTALVRSTGTFAVYRLGSWDLGTLTGTKLVVAGQQVVGSRANAIATPVGGTVVDAPCRDSVSQILMTLRQHGLIAT
ncbi:MAG: DUF2793 domain-containing protein [Sphingomicrobium sp.]